MFLFFLYKLKYQRVPVGTCHNPKAEKFYLWWVKDGDRHMNYTYERNTCFLSVYLVMIS